MPLLGLAFLNGYTAHGAPTHGRLALGAVQSAPSVAQTPAETHSVVIEPLNS